VKKSLLVCTPMHSGMCTSAYTMSILDLQMKCVERGIHFGSFFLDGVSIISMARDKLAKVFLESGYDYLLFIDADILFNADEVLEMLNYDVDVIGGVYPKRHIDWGGIVSAARRGVSVEDIPLHGSEFTFLGPREPVKIGDKKIVEVDGIGTGMMLVKRKVFLEMSKHVRTYTDVDGGVNHMFFPIYFDEESNRLWPEDYSFCRKWKSLGGKIYAAPWIRMKHVGLHDFG
jgi:hypothetical protein